MLIIKSSKLAIDPITAPLTRMLDLRDIKLLIDTFKQYLDRHQFTLEDKIIQGTTFDYFHVRKDIYNEIYPSNSIIEKDPELLANAHHFEGRSFCITSRGTGCGRVIT